MLFERLPQDIRNRTRKALNVVYGPIGPLSSWSVDQVQRLIRMALRDDSLEFDTVGALIELERALTYHSQRVDASKSIIERALAKQAEQQQRDDNES